MTKTKSRTYPHSVRFYDLTTHTYRTRRFSTPKAAAAFHDGITTRATMVGPVKTRKA